MLSMVPSWVQNEGGAQNVQNVQRTIPHLIPRTSFAFGPSGMTNSPDNYHYSAAAQRLMGPILKSAMASAVGNISPIWKSYNKQYNCQLVRNRTVFQYLLRLGLRNTTKGNL